MADSLTADNLSYDGEWQPLASFDPNAIARAVITNDGDRYELRALGRGQPMSVQHRRPDFHPPYAHVGTARWEDLSAVAEIINRHRADILAWCPCHVRRKSTAEST